MDYFRALAIYGEEPPGAHFLPYHGSVRNMDMSGDTEDTRRCDDQWKDHDAYVLFMHVSLPLA